MASPKQGADTRNGRPRAARSAPRRGEILDAAAHLFWEKGFGATNTQDIGERVGILKGSLYYYFDSKESLLLEIIEQIHLTLARSIEDVATLDGSALEKIWAFVYQAAVVNVVNHASCAVFVAEFQRLGKEDQARMMRMRVHGDQVLQGFVVQGQEDGSVCELVDPELASTSILSMCSTIHRWYRPGAEWTPEAVAGAYADLAVAQVRCNPTLHASHVRHDVEALESLALRVPLPAAGEGHGTPPHWLRPQ